MLGIPSAGLSVLDLPLRGRRASRRIENEDEIEIEDEKNWDGLPKIRGHTPTFERPLTFPSVSCYNYVGASTPARL